MDYVFVTSHRPQRPQLSPLSPEQQLIQAIRNGRKLDTLYRLLDNVADVNAKGDGFWTPLTLASYLGLYNFVSRLLHLKDGDGPPASCKSCSNATDQSRSERETPISDSETTDTFSGPNSPQSSSDTDLMCVTLEDAERKLTNSPEPSGSGTTNACGEGDRPELRKPDDSPELDASGSTSACNEDKREHRKRNRTTMVTPRRVCQINECNDAGESALICAVRSSTMPLCDLLLEHGADVNLPSQSSRYTALHIAVENCSLEAVNLLLQRGADVQVYDNVGITPLYLAIKTRSATMVRRLVKAGCDVNIGSQDHAPIFLASRLGLLDICKVLCEAGCDINVQNKYGVSPVYEAALKGHTQVLSYLLEQGGSVNQMDMYNSTPLHVAAMNGNVETIRILATAGGNMRMRDQQGRCPVHLAIQQGKSQAVQAFLELGVDIVHPAPPYFPLVWWQSLLNNAGARGVCSQVIVGSSALPLPSLLHLASLICNRPAIPLLMLKSGLQGAEDLLRELLESKGDSMDSGTVDAISQFLTQPLSLKALARIYLRRSLGNRIFYLVPLLPLPAPLQSYLLMSDCDAEI